MKSYKITVEQKKANADNNYRTFSSSFAFSQPTSKHLIDNNKDLTNFKKGKMNPALLPPELALIILQYADIIPPNQNPWHNTQQALTKAKAYEPSTRDCCNWNLICCILDGGCMYHAPYGECVNPNCCCGILNCCCEKTETGLYGCSLICCGLFKDGWKAAVRAKEKREDRHLVNLFEKRYPAAPLQQGMN